MRGLPPLFDDDTDVGLAAQTKETKWIDQTLVTKAVRTWHNHLNTLKDQITTELANAKACIAEFAMESGAANIWGRVPAPQVPP